MKIATMKKIFFIEIILQIVQYYKIWLDLIYEKNVNLNSW